MAVSVFKLDNEQMHSHVAEIQDAIDAYNELGEKPFKAELEAMKGMNSDFTRRLTDMLENLNDSNEKIRTTLLAIATATSQIVDNFEKMDDEIAVQLEAE